MKILTNRVIHYILHMKTCNLYIMYSVNIISLTDGVIHYILLMKILTNRVIHYILHMKIYNLYIMYSVNIISLTDGVIHYILMPLREIVYSKIGRSFSKNIKDNIKIFGLGVYTVLTPKPMILML